MKKTLSIDFSKLTDAQLNNLTKVVDILSRNYGQSDKKNNANNNCGRRTRPRI